MPATTRKRQQPEAISRPRKRLQNGPPRKGTSVAMTASEPMDVDETLCTECREINLDKIFGRNLPGTNGTKKKKRLDRTDEKISLRLDGANGECRLCQFLFPSRIAKPTSMDPHYELCLLSAKTKFGASRAADIVDSIALIIRPKYRPVGSLEERVILEERPQEPNVFSARRLGPQVNISLVGDWLEFCDKNHGACKEPDLPIPGGFRVLDCVDRTITEWDRLSDPGKRYVALSYVWGGDQVLSLGSRESVSARSEVKVPQPLPRTIEDAVSVTQSLGCRYLWVDRYCIPQDDPTAKHLQLQGMDAIYQHAFFTIIAAAGDNPHHGLPGVRDTPRQAPPQCTVGSRTLISVPLARYEILKSTWNTRGWTYQEGLLSRRKVVFTDSQMYYQCNAMHCLEGIRAPLESLHVRNKSRMSDKVNMSRVFPLHTIGRKWHVLGALISEYISRTLTFENDILDAFRGILAVHERRFPGLRTLAGLLFVKFPAGDRVETLTNGISWFFQKERGKSCILKLDRRPGFPSWTWLGWKTRGAVSIMLRDQMPTYNLTEGASFEYTDGVVLPWDASHRYGLIIARGMEGQIPLFLRIHGRALQVQVDIDGELTAENNLLRHSRSARDPNRRFWCDVVNWTRETYSPTVPFPLTFTLLAVRYRTDIDVEFLVLHQPPGCGHSYRIDIVIYPWLPEARGLGSVSIVWGLLRDWPMREVKIG